MEDELSSHTCTWYIQDLFNYWYGELMPKGTKWTVSFWDDYKWGIAIFNLISWKPFVTIIKMYFYKLIMDYYFLFSSCGTFGMFGHHFVLQHQWRRFGRVGFIWNKRGIDAGKQPQLSENLNTVSQRVGLYQVNLWSLFYFSALNLVHVNQEPRAFFFFKWRHLCYLLVVTWWFFFFNFTGPPCAWTD